MIMDLFWAAALPTFACVGGGLVVGLLLVWLESVAARRAVYVNQPKKSRRSRVRSAKHCLTSRPHGSGPGRQRDPQRRIRWTDDTDVIRAVDETDVIMSRCCE